MSWISNATWSTLTMPTQRNIKAYQFGLREVQSKLEGEQMAKEKAQDALIVADRKCISNPNALQ